MIREFDIGLIGIATIGIFSVLVFFIGARRPSALLVLYAASLPFFGVIAEVGIQVTPYLVVALMMGLVLVLAPGRIRLPGPMVPFMIYAVGITLVMAFFLPDTVHTYPPLRGQFRWLSQVVVFTFLYLPLVFACTFHSGKDDVRRMIDVFLAMSVILCLTGIAQLVLFRSTGTDPFPINLFSGVEDHDELRSALSRISAKEKILRMSGLGAGEPKHFGYTLVMGFTLNLLSWLERIESPVWSGPFRRAALALLFGLCILLSLSTQAYLLLGLNVALITIWWLLRKGILNRRSLALAGFLAIGVILVTTSEYARRLIELRIYERLSDTGAVEDFNQTISRFLVDEPKFLPFGTGLGNIHFWASRYIPHEFAYYMRDTVFVAKAGFLRVVSELGIVGFFLFASGYLIYILRARRRSQARARMLWFYLLLVMVSFTVTSDAAPYYIFSLTLLILMLDRPDHETTQQAELT